MKPRNWFGALLLAAACTPSTRPPALVDLQATRDSPSAVHSMASAPQAFAEARRIHEQAERAWEAGDSELAADLGALASIAYQRAIALGRLARAEEIAAVSAESLQATRDELATLLTEQKKLEAAAQDLELRAKVLQDAEPISPLEAANPERERARRSAARALLTEAKLLCVTESLVLGNQSSETGTTLDRIAQTLSASPTTNPGALLEQSRELRADCLRRLTLARRPASRTSPNAGVADALLTRLSETGEFHPFRDDRGVVVLLGAPATNEGLTPQTETKLEHLGRIASAHPEFALLVVWHTAGSKSAAMSNEEIITRIQRALSPTSPERVRAESVGQTQPLVDPTSPGAAAQNFRLEVVFVSPSIS